MSLLAKNDYDELVAPLRAIFQKEVEDLRARNKILESELKIAHTEIEQTHAFYIHKIAEMRLEQKLKELEGAMA